VTSTEAIARLEEATNYTFKDEDIDQAYQRVGKYYPIAYREQITQATHDSMRNFARSYGDDNPLYHDLYYGRTTRWGGQLAAPLIIQVMNRAMLGDPGPKRVPFRGIQVFVSGSTNNWYRPIREGDVLYRFGGLESFTEKQSEFAGRSFVEVRADVHVNQNAEIVAISRTTAVRTERKAARENKKYSGIAPAEYSADDIARHDAIYAAEKPRGSEPRFWEDVSVGDVLGPLAKGPVTVTDFMVFHAGGYGFHYKPATGRIGYKNRQRIPAFYIQNEQGVPDIAMRLHWDKDWAQANGNPMPYDYGVLRDCWLSHVFTDWMGDDAWLTFSSSTIRKFNYIGDLHVMQGEVTGKRIEGEDHLVDVTARGINQRGDTTCIANGTIMLPSKTNGPVVLPVPPRHLQQRAVELMSEHRRLERDLRELQPFISL